MEMILPLAKRINLEHSYALLAYDSTAVHVKQEDPLKIPEQNDCVSLETIKIEVEEETTLIKTEPVEEIIDEGYNFDYVDTKKESEQPISQYPVDNLTQVQNICKAEKVTSDNLQNNDNPIKLVKFEYIKAENLQASSNTKKLKRNNSKSKNAIKEIHDDLQSKSYLRLQKEKENLQKLLVKLRSDLKATKAREKALQTELGARCMSERALEDKNTKLNQQLQESLKKEKTNLQQIRELNEKLALSKKQTSIKWALSERERKNLIEKVEKLKAQEVMRTKGHQQLENKCAELTQTCNQLTSKVDVLKVKLSHLKKSMMIKEASHKELQKMVAQSQRSNEDLQKSLMAEKKMSRFFVKERDGLLDVQEKKYKEAQQELARLKHMIGTMNKAFADKASECKSLKEESRSVIAKYKGLSAELEVQIKELEEKKLELSKKVCEYCGF